MWCKEYHRKEEVSGDRLTIMLFAREDKKFRLACKTVDEIGIEEKDRGIEISQEEAQEELRSGCYFLHKKHRRFHKHPMSRYPINTR